MLSVLFLFIHFPILSYYSFVCFCILSAALREALCLTMSAAPLTKLFFSEEENTKDFSEDYISYQSVRLIPTSYDPPTAGPYLLVMRTSDMAASFHLLVTFCSHGKSFEVTMNMNGAIKKVGKPVLWIKGNN